MVAHDELAPAGGLAIGHTPGQRQQMARFAGLEPERVGNPAQRVFGGPDRPRLLQRVPLGADPRQGRDLLAPQPGSPAPPAG
jgi:hypothetical protein